MKQLDVSELRAVLAYDAETGHFLRRVRLAQRHAMGDRADFEITGGPMTGYRRVGLFGARYLAHRLAWFYVHGEWPKHEIDHINCQRGDNRIVNLRDVPKRVNLQNRRKPRSDNKSGFLGVHLHPETGKWRSRVQLGNRFIDLGLHHKPEDAHQAYIKAKRQLHEGCTL